MGSGIPKEPSVLLEHDKAGKPTHVVAEQSVGTYLARRLLTAYDMEALRSGDLRRASQLASGVYKLTRQ